MATEPWRDAEQLREWYLDKEMSTTEIAEAWGASSSTIHRWLDEHGIETRDQGTGNQLRQRKETASFRERIRSRYEEDATPAEIARSLDRPETTIRYWIDRMGLSREAFSCPTCGDTFDTETGVKIHHARQHDESIAGADLSQTEN